MKFLARKYCLAKMEKKKLNVDIARAISDFEDAIKAFQLKEKIYRIIYRGKGLEFESYQDYTPDQDAVNIDWKASLRANKPITKRYKEERDLKIVFLIDVSENMVLGSTKKLKCEYAAEMIAALAHLMITSNDNVGYALFSDKIKDYVPPKKGLNHLFSFIDRLSDSITYGGSSNISGAYEFALEYLDKSIDAIIFVSDFIKMQKDNIKQLYLLSYKCEMTALMVKDPLDKKLPNLDREIVIQDPTTGQQLLVNPKIASKIYEKYTAEQENLVKNIFLRTGIDLLSLITDKNFVLPLAEFLKARGDKGE